MAKKTKTKVFRISDPAVRGLSEKHRKNNGSNQCCVIIRSTTKARCAELLSCSMADMRRYHPAVDITEWEVPNYIPNKPYIPSEDEVDIIFYSPDGFTKEGVGFDRNWYRLDTGECVKKND